MNRKKWVIRVFFFLGFCAFVFVSPAARDVPMSERIQMCFGGALFAFIVPILGRFIAVKLFKCYEWDKEEGD